MNELVHDDRQVAVVTGAGRGLGRHVAVRLARLGWDLVLIARTETQLRETATAVEQAGREALVQIGDLRDRSLPGAVSRAATDRFGSISALVCNAGIYVTEAAVETSDDSWDDIVDTNLGSAFRFARTVGRHFIERGRGGSIVMVGSIFGLTGVSNTAAYAASKGGLTSLTRTLAVEWARHDITVNMVAPGHMRTALSADQLETEQAKTFIRRNIPAGRVAEPDEVAAHVVHLLGSDSRFVTGAVNVVDGGYVAR